MRHQAIRAAHRVLTKCRIRRFPIMIEQVCRDLGIPVFRQPLEKDGYCVNSDGFRMIMVSDALCPVRRRFTVAHELGHLVLGHPSLMAANGAGPLERQAHLFAAEALMPEPMLRDEIKRLRGLSLIPSVDQLALEFAVSKSAMEIRLKEVGANCSFFGGKIKQR